MSPNLSDVLNMGKIGGGQSNNKLEIYLRRDFQSIGSREKLVLSWNCTTIILIAGVVVTRRLVRGVRPREFWIEDVLAYIAYTSTVMAVVISLVAVGSGLGQHVRDLHSDTITKELHRFSEVRCLVS
ncbi:hypothetical protein VTK73DRAFT_1273 [Phialemonium thermophilum]|uniref:Uncharacterized protein n=1 Tax=Phialemonium thermophilum TaxID=223376 RepID=A0ABR3XAU2_9PEZI